MAQEPSSDPRFPPTPDDDEANTRHLPPTKDTPSVVTRPAAKGPSQLDLVDTPTSPSSAFALSRFEFESNKGNEGTKILMVEWDSAAASVAASAEATQQRAAGGEGEGGPTDKAGPQPQDRAVRRGADGTPANYDDNWSVTWDGKASYNVIPVQDATTDNGSTVHRMYFLLPPGAHIPPLVSISRGEDVTLCTKPMPAIYPAGLARATHQAAARRGVLHTLWAQRRLADLAAEIEAEMKTNCESIGLQIAIQEHAWIAEHFDVGVPIGSDAAPPRAWPSPGHSMAQLSSLRSPSIGGKLGEKLKGLRLATSPAELAAASQASKAAAENGTRSAQFGGSSRGMVLGAHAGAHTVVDLPAGVIHSLDAVMQDERAKDGQPTKIDATEGEDELFALPMSPRSPDMAKSPFSFL
ncbi:hypothetical protein SPI_05178 [Niveomyces insectorum RCEF 264]|uniref:Uncharacterized protein n=1 Tax=Niveomyces insectorum RCEF 264 TaxID=1081102 RepID=A0A167U194_9HYPO|nr:hypothetical protein SPI_05178 [Niveomyces insectorum RCEF 264]